MSDKNPPGLDGWRRRIFATLWVTYASFYLCRVNLAVAIPKIIEDTGFTRSAMGLLGSIFFVVYAAGQFINGQLGDRWNPRFLILTGAICSACASILFGFSSVFAVMAVLWGMNGYFQAMGWSSCVKVLTNWFPHSKKGMISGLFSTSYYLGNVLSWFLAGWLLLYFSWRVSFWVPAILFLGAAVQFLIFERNSPGSAGFKPEAVSAGAENPAELVMQGLPLLSNPGLWQAGFAAMCLSIMSSGFIYWIPTYLYEEIGFSISGAAFRALVFPLAGCGGAKFAGWASDRLAGSKRSPVAAAMLSAAVFLVLLLPGIKGAGILIVALVALMGFAINGPQMLLAVTLAMDFGGKEKSASTAGFIDAMSYVGAGIGAFTAGFLVDRFGWKTVFQFWAGVLIATILMVLLVWRKENLRHVG